MGSSCWNWRDDRDRVFQRSAASYHGRGRSRDVDGGGGCAVGWKGPMIPLPSGVRVWLATGHTDMRKGFASLALLVQEVLERGRFLWPSVADGAVTISPAQLGYLLSGIDWRHPQESWRPTSMG